MNKLQAQLEADVKKEPKKITVKPSYQIAEAILSGKDQDDRKEYEARKEARLMKHEQEQAELNRLKEEYQKKKEAEEKARREARGKEMEKNKNMVNGKEHETKAPLSKKEIEINKRIPPLEVTPSSSEAELRDVTVNLISLLKEVYGDVFDLQIVKKSLDNQYAELEKELKNETKALTVFIPVEGKVKQRREEAQNMNKSDTYRTTGASKEIIKAVSVKNRLAMFENKRS